MSDIPTVEVQVRRGGEVIHRERCESPEQAALVVDSWSDTEGVTVEVVDLLNGSEPEDLTAAPDEDAYPFAE